MPSGRFREILTGCLIPAWQACCASGWNGLSVSSPGFAGGNGVPAAVMTGVETRTSSPVRILRDESFQSPGMAGLYPCGEGAGYAGGIMSAAVDGLRVAEAIISRYAPPDL